MEKQGGRLRSLWMLIANRNQWWSTVSKVGAFSFATGIVFAGGAAAADNSSAGLETVTVTARRVEENNQTVPATVNVISGADLEQKGAQTLSDMSNLVPNFTWRSDGNDVGENSGIIIRGIPSNDNVSGFSPGVGVYVDDVYQASGTSFNSALLDIDKVQVLKGPQGTLFGRNTIAGAIVINTRLPSLDRAYVEGDADAGDFGLAQTRAVANYPITSDLAVKISAIYRTREGYNYNIVTGKHDVNDENHYGGMAELLYTPNNDIDLVLRTDWFQDRTADGAQGCYGAGFLGNLCKEHSTLNSTLDRVVASDPPSESNRDMWGSSLHGTWRAPGGFEVTSVTAYNRVDTAVLQDETFVGRDYVRSGGGVQNDWTFSQELRVASPQEDRLRGVTGVYYIHQNEPEHVPLTFAPDLFNLLGLPTAPPSSYAMAQTDTTDALTITNSYAVFGQAQYDLTPKVTIEGGLRYTEDQKNFTYQETVPSALIPLIPLGLPDPVTQFSRNASWGALTGTASVSWHPTEEAMAYVLYSRGYKSGGFNGNTSSVSEDPTVPFNPEYVDSFEGGLKYENSEKTLRANLAIFNINYSDIQTQTVDPLTRIKFISNTASATSHGAELEVTLVPLDHLMINVGGGIQDTKSGASGAPLQYVQPVTGSFNATYSYPLFDGAAGIVSITGIYGGGDVLNAPVTEHNYEQLNARIGIETDKWGVYLWSNNLTNETRIMDYTPSLYTAATTVINPPRTDGVEVKARF